MSIDREDHHEHTMQTHIQMRAPTEAPSDVLQVRPRRSARATVAIAVVAVGVLTTSLAFSQSVARVVAIDVLLRVGAATVERAKSVNAQLRKAYPQGYSLDAAHTPHITLVQRFVRASDIDAISAAVATVLKTERLSDS